MGNTEAMQCSGPACTEVGPDELTRVCFFLEEYGELILHLQTFGDAVQLVHDGEGIKEKREGDVELYSQHSSENEIASMLRTCRAGTLAEIEALVQGKYKDEEKVQGLLKTFGLDPKHPFHQFEHLLNDTGLEVNLKVEEREKVAGRRGYKDAESWD